VHHGRPDTGKNAGLGDATGAAAGTGSNPGELTLGEAGTPPVTNEVRSPGNEICCGSGTGRNGICGKFSCAWGSNPAGPAGAAAGTVGVSPGTPRPGVAVVAAGEAGAETVGVSPGMPSPGLAVVAAGAGPGKSEVAPGTVDVAPGTAADGCGTRMLANGGGVAGCPARAVPRFCSTWGAPAAPATNCCPMFGAGTGAAGSAWAVPIRPPASSAADEPATTAVARNNVQMVDMTLPGSR